MKLPIMNFLHDIVEAVKSFDVVIVSAGTGSGKTTQVPAALHAAGFKVICTEPRRIAAISVSKYVAKLLKCALGTVVGYLTGYDKNASRDSAIIYCTDGLQLIRELTCTRDKNTVLVIDEAHEWNINIETLVGYCKKFANTKVVIMSATIETDKLAAFFPGSKVVEVPGTLFDVSVRQDDSGSMCQNIKALVEQGKNVLCFLPGKKEIADMQAALSGINATVLPLHGELESDEQQSVFAHYDNSKVVLATGIAQTSITIDDIHAVVDSGMERRIELVDNLEVLRLLPISQADCMQRKGRAGRTQAGEYILCSDTVLSERPQYSEAEIKRSRLDQTVLRLAAVGIDATELEFFHQPDKAVMAEAKRSLKLLGAMDETGKVTGIGHQMAKLPCNVQFARMIVEANKYGVVGDVATIAAILDTGKPGSLRAKNGNWRSVISERGSDLLVELDLFNSARNLKGQEFDDAGIFRKTFFQAKDLREKILQSVHGVVRKGSTGNREDILRSCIAGMVDHVYRVRYGSLVNGDGDDRQLDKQSAVSVNTGFCVGLPKDIEVPGRRGCMMKLRLVTQATPVSAELLKEIAPQLVTREDVIVRYDADRDTCTLEQKVMFNGQEVGREVLDAPDHPKASKAFSDFIADRYNQDEATLLNRRAGKEVFRVLPWGEKYKHFEASLGGAKSMKDLKDFSVLNPFPVDPVLATKVREENPDELLVDDITLKIQYEESGSVCYISLADLQKLTVPQVVLPSGSVVTLKYYYKSFKNVLDLKRSIRESSTDSIRDKAVYLWTERPIRSIDEIRSALESVGQEVEYFRDDIGGMSFFVGLKVYSGWGSTTINYRAFDTKESAISSLNDNVKVALAAKAKTQIIDSLGEKWSGYSGWRTSVDKETKDIPFVSVEQVQAEVIAAKDKLEVRVNAQKAELESLSGMPDYERRTLLAHLDSGDDISVRLAELRMKAESQKLQEEHDALLLILRSIRDDSGEFEGDVTEEEQLEAAELVVRDASPEATSAIREFIARVRKAIAEYVPEPDEAEEAPEEETEEETATAFADAGNRYFRCSKCGATERVSKAAYKIFRETGSLQLKCPKCGALS